MHRIRHDEKSAVSGLPFEKGRSADSGCWLVHRRGRIWEVSAELEAASGYTKAELEGKTLHQFVASNYHHLVDTKVCSYGESRYLVGGRFKNGHAFLWRSVVNSLRVGRWKARKAEFTPIVMAEEAFPSDRVSPTAAEILRGAIRLRDSELADFRLQLRFQRQKLADNISTNIDRIALPLIKRLDGRLDCESRRLLQALQDFLTGLKDKELLLSEKSASEDGRPAESVLIDSSLPGRILHGPTVLFLMDWYAKAGQ